MNVPPGAGWSTRRYVLSPRMRNARGAWQAALSAVAVLGLAACGGESEALCDRASVQAALDAASPGDEVRLGSCEVTGPLRVPAGVRLGGEADSVVVAPEGEGAVLLTPGETATELASVTVRVEGLVGVLARGEGAVSLRDVHVEVIRGIGLGVDGVTRLSMHTVVVQGPVDSESAGDPAFLRVIPAAPESAPCPAGTTCDCEPGDTDDTGRVCDASGHWATVGAAYGLYIQDVPEAILDAVAVRGLASFGAVVRDSSVLWRDGELDENMGVALRQVGGTVALERVVVSRTLQGLRGMPAYGLAATSTARLDSTGLVVRDNDRYGLVLLDSSGSQDDLVAEDNGDAAVWIGGARDVQVSGASIRRNGFAGIVVVGSEDVRVTGGAIEDTVAVERAVGTLGVRRMGDGVHLSASRSGIALEDLMLSNNGRAGLVVDLADGSAPLPAFTGVSVHGMGEQLGAVAGRADGGGQLTPVAPGGWDEGITRLGDAPVNDAMVSGALDSVVESAPSDLPAPLESVGVVAPMF